VAPYDVEAKLAGRPVPVPKPPTRWQRLWQSNEFRLFLYPGLVFLLLAVDWRVALLWGLFARDLVSDRL